MDAKTFGAFLARMRKSQGLTQAELAQQLHVTDKAVSRWERGVGLPDINTLEPLADALGLTLADLMHCRDPQEADIAPEVPLEDFFTLLRRQQSIDWRSVRAVLFWLSAALAIWGILALCFLLRKILLSGMSTMMPMAMTMIPTGKKLKKASG